MSTLRRHLLPSLVAGDDVREVLESYIEATEACDGERLRRIFHPKVGAFFCGVSREAVMHGYIGQKEFVGVEGFFKQMEQQKAP